MSLILPTAAEIGELPADGGADFNRLIFEKSPYLLQHARNPVDWRPWGPEAFAEARATDRPVFLSVGYSTCHWCHVMERESFEVQAVADVLNALFVPIKVDREERPDIDEIYMAATQLVTGRGGWPMSVWLTPDGAPFFAGTYFPREDRVQNQPGQGPVVHPGFVTVLERLSEYWVTQRQSALDQAAQLSEAVQRHMRQGGPADAPLEGDLLARALDDLRESYDREHGGFSHRPKFPPHQALRLLLLAHDRTAAPGALAMALHTLDAMADGGVHDHVGGGFHRYSTDERWFLPHFEKMLYDNAQLARAYVDAWRLTDQPRYRAVAEGILRWTLREMRDPAGGFFSALDADSEGEEGTFYVWTPEELAEILGPDDAALYGAVHGFELNGNWRDESTGEPIPTNVVHLPRPLADAARAHDIDADALIHRIAAAHARLYAIRAQRIWPHLDDKVLTACNGLMIGALAYAGATFDEPLWTDAAARAADFLLATMRAPHTNRLLATYRDGGAKLPAYLDDHALLADGLLDLHAATDDPRWLSEAQALVETLRARFADPDAGGFFFTADDHEQLLVRSRSGIDRAIPSGNGVAARVLARLADLTGDPTYAADADRTIQSFAPLIARHPRAAESLVLAWAIRNPPAAPTPGTARASDGPISILASLPAPDRLRITLTCAPGWHVQSNRPGVDHVIATSITATPGPGLTVGPFAYPDGQPLELPGPDPLTLSVYSGETHFDAALRTSSPHDGSVAITVRYQPCDDRSCRRTTRLSLALVVPAERTPSG